MTKQSLFGYERRRFFASHSCLAAVLILLMTIGGCASGQVLRADAAQIEKKISEARTKGSYRCTAPELARAEAHLEFLHSELDLGRYRQAAWHHRAAIENIDTAIANTDPDVCAEKEVIFASDQSVVITHTNPDVDGDGIPNELDGCPDDPEDLDLFEDENGCPDLDNDGDTVLDQDDICPLQPGPVDAGGCPVTDRDSDGISDDIDQCPDVPGNPPMGCPERVLVKVTKTQIEINEQINFELDKAIIAGDLSFQILDQVAAVLTSRQELEILIEGHTDSTGSDDYNLDLSNRRAAAVLEALVERGILQARMRSQGLGETRPIASNETSRGRAANRRVEFHIVSNDAANGDTNSHELPPL